MEHERQRFTQRQLFEDQMHVLKQKQDQELLSILTDPNGSGGVQHLAVSVLTTPPPPRINAQLSKSYTLMSVMSTYLAFSLLYLPAPQQTNASH